MASSPRKGSQFAGAAALFQKKEKELLEKNGSLPPSTVSPQPAMNKRGNSSVGNIGYSPRRDSGSTSLKPPPFVSPGAGGSNRPAWNNSANNYPTSSYLDKPGGTPSQKPKLKVGASAFSGLTFSPSPDKEGKPKLDSKSWKDKPSISFQATSPGALNKKAVRPAFNQHYGGSFLEKDSPAKGAGFEETPDIKIEVKIPDIDKKIRARRETLRQAEHQSKEEHVPEWLMKQRQREANRIRQESEKKERSTALIQAYWLGWKARRDYSVFLAANADRLHEIREKERMRLVKINSAVTIQRTWRGFLPRQRFMYVRECKRRRLRNEKEIKRIAKVIAKMPKETKGDIKEMKKEYAEKKKNMKKRLKQLLNEDDKRLEDIQKSGRDMIEYMQTENKKLKEKHQALKAEYKVLEKQFDLLNEKSDEIARNFASLQSFVQKKNVSIQKNEIVSQKCRHRYLPKYRSMIKDRDKHCIVEHKIGMLYKKRLESIVDLLVEKCSNRDVVFDAKEALAACKWELEQITPLPVPNSLQDKL